MKKIFFCIAVMVLQACAQNIFDNSSSVSNDDALFQDALNALNGERFDESILIIDQQMSGSARSKGAVRELRASAFAGRCGLNFLDYTTSLANQGSGSAMRIMMMPFVGRAVAPADCVTALETLELIGPTETRSLNQNTFASIVGMVLVGSALRGSSDISPARGDGTADVDICAAVTDAEIDQMIIGFGYFNKNFSAVGSSTIGDFADGTFQDVIATCESAAGSACIITNPLDITPGLRVTFRDLANTSDFGIGSFSTGGDPLAIPNSCP